MASSGAICTFLIALSLLLVAVSSTNDQEICSRRCLELNCDNVGIKYGKYCGVGHTGCPGEKPCDDLDACCQIHDDCVGRRGMTNVKCHKKFKNCVKKVHKSGSPGFSKICHYDLAVATMVQGMDMAILMSQWANPDAHEL
ncbi:hypothetical protein V2J09_002568 [Rumex salicifolius]